MQDRDTMDVQILFSLLKVMLEMITANIHLLIQIEAVCIVAMCPNSRVNVNLDATQPMCFLIEPLHQASSVTSATKSSTGNHVIHIEVIAPS